MASIRLRQILRGKAVAPLTDLESAVKAAVDAGGSAGLPTVTAADNGKVLTVVDGAWAAVAPAQTNTET